jgi:hypothetical protein
MISIFSFSNSAYAVTVSGVTYPFSLTTKSIAANGTFKFALGAQGTFYVDCGSGGTLSGTGASGGTIDKQNTNEVTYTCTYSTAGQKKIQFGGVATAYRTSGYTSTMRISSAISNSGTLVSSISGNVSAIFPYLGSSAGQYPQFKYLFFGCDGLKSIPSTLFSNITTGAPSMFYQTFYGCTGLTTIPSTLFSNITTGAPDMFCQTFYGCTGLTSIPNNLFSSITTYGADMFYQTFAETSMIGLMWDGSGVAPATYCKNGGTFIPPTPAARTGYVFTGWKAITAIDRIREIDTSINGSQTGSISNGGTASGRVKADDFGLTFTGSWATSFNYGVVYGYSRCGSTSGDNHNKTWTEPASDWLKEATSSSYTYCWCKIIGFTPVGNDYTLGVKYVISPLGSHWVFMQNDTGGPCSFMCAYRCAGQFKSSVALRTALIGSVGQ